MMLQDPQEKSGRMWCPAADAGAALAPARMATVAAASAAARACLRVNFTLASGVRRCEDER
jgi:hypothetical protein